MSFFKEKLSLATFFFIIIFFILFLLFSCKKDEYDIPSYIQIDSIDLKTDYSNQGTASHNITDGWIYIDNELIGAFELPAKFPVLKQGKHDLIIKPGIKLNGISSTRSFYPFYKPVKRQIKLVRDSVTRVYDKIYINPVSHDTTYIITTAYKDNVVFAWMEDFEDPSLSVKPTNKSDTIMKRISKNVFQGSWSGKVGLDDVKNIFECVTKQDYILPKNDAYVFLELNYKNNNTVNIGIFANYTDKVEQQPLVILNKSDKWNKIYINLTQAVSRNYNAVTFDPFIGIMKEDQVDNPEIYFDNIKLIYFN